MFLITLLSLILAQPEPQLQPVAAAAPVTTVDDAIARAVEIILTLQEGDAKDRWPYEGVYRVEGKIPIGYEVGGTAICATALMRAPGYEGDAARSAAVSRGARFVCEAIAHPLMSIDDYDAGYDVRWWGYTYGLAFLLEAKARQAVPAESVPPELVEKAIAFYLDGVHRTEIPGVGGWNYARPRGRDKPAPPSSFMTGPTLLALFEAKRQGYTVDADVVSRALDTLAAARTPAGGVVYSGKAGENPRDAVPGATGRMLAAETTLFLAGGGRGSVAGIRGALDAFITHWEWLEKRRAQPGTHVGPYAIAPYYFYYAHYHAAMAVEMLPEGERAEYRRRVHELIFRTRGEDGSWNDRVFPRSAAYGTAMSSMALLMPRTPIPATWVEQLDRPPE
ncbi:MAG: hypothetical protein ACKVU4_08515 [Phycisphaerales bacterium]